MFQNKIATQPAKKPIRLNDLRDGDSVWVLNRSGAKGDEAGELVITVTSDEGQLAVTVPNTFIPIDLAAQAPFDALRKSSRVLMSLANKTIELITEEEAQQRLSLPEAQQEAARLAAIAAGDLSKVVGGARREPEPETAAPKRAPQLELAFNILDNLKADRISVDDSIIMLSTMEKMLSSDDVIELMTTPDLPSDLITFLGDMAESKAGASVPNA